MADDTERKRGLSSLWENLTKGAQNALELARVGRLSPEVHAPYTVVRRERVYKLRHYERNVEARGSAREPNEAVSQPLEAPLLLVPPLMLTAEIYDIDPEISTVTQLTNAGVDTWLVDFGIPEQEEGGLERTLDDHIRAVSQAVDQVRSLTGKDVHLAGYSQGGMFCYQTAAYRNSAGLKSLITFGSPVDVHRNMMMRDDLAGRVIDSLSGLVRSGLKSMDALPGTFSSRGFRVLSAGKEMRHLLSFVGNLHDREAIMRGESSRRYLHGEGFVAWPGPALRSFYEQFVVQNRLTQGGFIIEGRTLTLADIKCPILFFVGERDEFARPPSVRAIREATPYADSYEYTMRTGHFGLVVGSMAVKQSWPAVIDWIRWHEGKGTRPAHLRGNGETEPPKSTASSIEDVIEANFEDVEYNARLFFDTAKETASFVKRRVEGVSGTFVAMFDNLRYQVPRLAKLERLEPDTRISAGLALAEQGERNGENTFFLYNGRAHTYADADRRVNAIVRGLIACGVKSGMRVGVMMQARPSYLSLVTALSRLGAVSVLISPDERRVSLELALKLGEVEILVSDPERAEAARHIFQGPVLVLGGGGGARKLLEGVIDMEAIDPEKVELPSWYEPNPGRASDLAMVIFTAGKDEKPRAARITNRRWAVAAYGAAAASTLTVKDTVYCCMPLDHAAGLLVSVGGALVGGARLALAEDFDPNTFWADVRRYGATVVYYAGEMCRALVDAPSLPTDDKHPVRLFAGSGMRTDVWKRLVDRFGTGVLEFYATTEGNAVLANVAGKPVGSLGKPLPGTAEVAIVSFDFENNDFMRDAEGKLVRCFTDQPGMLIARIDSSHALASFDGYLDSQESKRRVVRGAFEAEDAWFVTGDVVRADASGNHWFVDRAADMMRTPKGPVSTLQVEDALYELPEIQHAVVYGVPVPGASHDMPVATIVTRDGYQLDPATLAKHVERRLDPNARPVFVRLRDNIPMSVGYRPMKQPLREQGVEVKDGRTWSYDQDHKLYEPITEARYADNVDQLGGAVTPPKPGKKSSKSPKSAKKAGTQV